MHLVMNMQVITNGNEKQIGKPHSFCDSGKFPKNKQSYWLISGWQREGVAFLEHNSFSLTFIYKHFICMYMFIMRLCAYTESIIEQIDLLH